jgi:hypothetical protein
MDAIRSIPTIPHLAVISDNFLIILHSRSTVELLIEIRDLNHNIISHFFVNFMLKGAENLSLYANITKHARLIMTFIFLKLVCQKIYTSNWKPNSKKSVLGSMLSSIFWFSGWENSIHSESLFCTIALPSNCINFFQSCACSIKASVQKPCPLSRLKLIFFPLL